MRSKTLHKFYGPPNIDRQLLAAKADEIDALIKRLRAVSNGLRHAAASGALEIVGAKPGGSRGASRSERQRNRHRPARQ